jgi:flagellar biosynthesis protein FlhA
MYKTDFEKSLPPLPHMFKDIFGDFDYSQTPPSNPEVISLYVGYMLIPLVDPEEDGILLKNIKSIRKQIAAEIGITIPPVQIQDDMLLDCREYSIFIKGNEVAHGELYEQHYLATATDLVVEEIDGLPTKDPIKGLKAIWINENDRDEAVSKEYSVVDLATIISNHLFEIIKRNAHEIIGQHEVQQMLDDLKKSRPEVVKKLIPDILPLEAVVAVIQKLLEEQVPVYDLPTILEALTKRAPVTKDLDKLTQYVRQLLAKHIANTHQTKIA